MKDAMHKHIAKHILLIIGSGVGVLTIFLNREPCTHLLPMPI